MSSNVATLVDYTAWRAGIYVPGLTSVAAAGQDVYPDPFRAGQTIAAAASNPVAPLSHWSELPTAPAVEWIDQDGTVQLAWTIPMRLWISKAPIEDVRRILLPFYDRYLAAFVPDPTLGGLALRSQIAGFSVASNDDWAWLEVRLTAVEMVRYV